MLERPEFVDGNQSDDSIITLCLCVKKKIYITARETKAGQFYSVSIGVEGIDCCVFHGFFFCKRFVVRETAAKFQTTCLIVGLT